MYWANYTYSFQVVLPKITLLLLYIKLRYQFSDSMSVMPTFTFQRSLLYFLSLVTDLFSFIFVTYFSNMGESVQEIWVFLLSHLVFSWNFVPGVGNLESVFSQMMVQSTSNIIDIKFDHYLCRANFKSLRLSSFWMGTKMNFLTRIKVHRQKIV